MTTGPVNPGGALGKNIGYMYALGNGLFVVGGQHTTTAAVDTISTGLSTVLCAVANMETAPAVGADMASAFIGDQAGTPAAGSIQIKTWKRTSTADTTPVAATSTSRKVNWFAIGTRNQ